jgi:hypothetical protein
MADPPAYPGGGDDSGEELDRESGTSRPTDDHTARDQEPARTSRWASKVVIAIFAALVVLMVILHLTGVVGPGTH